MLLAGAPWQSAIGKMLAGRRGEETGSAVADSHREDAGRGAVAKRLVRSAAVAERHQEDAGRGAVAERHQKDAARREMR